jgi:hypothetical protein
MTHNFERLTPDQPTQAVQDEANRIIEKLDGRPNSQWNIDRPSYDNDRALEARKMLIEDSQKLSPKDMHDLLWTIMTKEDHKKGYDLAIYSHSTADVRDMQQKTDDERQRLGMLMANCTKEERMAAFKKFNEEHDQALENYKQERVVTLTHYSTPGEYGEKGRTPGADISVAAYRSVDGLPDFKIVNDK